MRKFNNFLPQTPISEGRIQNVRNTAKKIPSSLSLCFHSSRIFPPYSINARKRKVIMRQELQ